MPKTVEKRMLVDINRKSWKKWSSYSLSGVQFDVHTRKASIKNMEWQLIHSYPEDSDAFVWFSHWDLQLNHVLEDGVRIPVKMRVILENHTDDVPDSYQVYNSKELRRIVERIEKKLLKLRKERKIR